MILLFFDSSISVLFLYSIGIVLTSSTVRIDAFEKKDIEFSQYKLFFLNRFQMRNN